jgi:methyl-accepting chemotaxis protein
MSLFLAALVTVTASGVVGMSYLLHKVSATARELSVNSRANANTSFDLVSRMANLQGTTQRLIGERDPDAIESLTRESESLVKESQTAIDETATRGDDLQAAFARLLAANTEVKNLALVARNADAQQVFIERSNPAFESLLQSIRKHHEQLTHEQDSKAAQAYSRAAWGQSILMILVLASGLTVAVFGVVLRRSIIGGLARIIEMTKDIAEGEGDLTKRLAITSRDELGELAKWFNIFLDKLHNVIVQVAATAEHVASASEEISASATQTANGSETQKDQVHQVATAMQQMSATVHEVSENSRRAADSARQAADTACQGGAIVEDSVSRMRSIAESVRETAQKVQELGKRSDQIGRIVNVIDDIADQTNLLALNAAIEAARAGEQGRGFAVVADEVRKLAERTTQATKEIAEMIKKVQSETHVAVERMQAGTQQVQQGVEATGHAGESLRRIIEQAGHVGEVVTHIATTATQQSSATEQVNNHMDQINKLVAESAEGAQQSAKACEQLSGLAFELQNLVSRFKLGQQTKGGATSGGHRAPLLVTGDPVRARAALASAARPPVQRAWQHAEHLRTK